MARRLAGRRRWAGSVSRTPTSATPASTTAAAVYVVCSSRHEVHSRITPPMVGARIGARPITSISRDISRATAYPENRSRTTAMATTEIAAPAKPWSTRTVASTSMVGASAASTEASAWPTRPATRGRRRPKASESGPMTS